MTIKIENHGIIIDEYTTDNLNEVKLFLHGYGATKDMIPLHLLGQVIDEITFNIDEVPQ